MKPTPKAKDGAHILGMDWELVKLLLALSPAARRREIKLFRAAIRQAEVFADDKLVEMTKDKCASIRN